MIHSNHKIIYMIYNYNIIVERLINRKIIWDNLVILVHKSIYYQILSPDIG